MKNIFFKDLPMFPAFSMLMRILKLSSFLFCLLLLQACDHPLGIEGEGDIVDLNNSGHGCTLEQFQSQDKACARNTVVYGYDVNYKAVPREGWVFVGWEGGCQKKGIGNCVLKVPASEVKKYWFKVMPTLTAVFSPAPTSPIENTYSFNTDIIKTSCTDGSKAKDNSAHFYINAQQSANEIDLTRDFIPNIPGFTVIDRSSFSGTINDDYSFSATGYTILAALDVPGQIIVNYTLEGQFSNEGWAGIYSWTTGLQTGDVCESSTTFDGTLKSNESIGGIWDGLILFPGGEVLNGIGYTTDAGELRFLTADGEQTVGTFTVDNGELKATLFSYTQFGYVYSDGSTAINGNAMGSLVPLTSFDGQATYQGVVTSSFSFSYNPIYDRNSSLDDMAGTFSRSNGPGYVESYSVDSNGLLAGSSTDGCLYNGKVSIINSQYNLYRLNITLSNCSSYDGSYSGLVSLSDFGGELNDTIIYSVTGPLWILTGIVPRI